MSDILTVEDLSPDSPRDKFPTPASRQFRRNAIAEIEALQAQNKRLVEALQEIIQKLKPHWGHVNEIGGSVLVADKALSTLPAEAIEAERRREEVVRAAIALYDWQGSDWLSRAGQRGHAFSSAVEALEALEGGK